MTLFIRLMEYKRWDRVKTDWLELPILETSTPQSGDPRGNWWRVKEFYQNGGDAVDLFANISDILAVPEGLNPVIYSKVLCFISACCEFADLWTLGDTVDPDDIGQLVQQLSEKLGN